MKKTIKTEWLKALRSGKYKQGKELLRARKQDEDDSRPTTKHCCLGVLCEVIKKDIKMKWDTSYDEHQFGGGEGRLSPEILKFVGLKPKTQSTLINMNDSGKYNFKQIARYISKNL